MHTRIWMSSLMALRWLQDINFWLWSFWKFLTTPLVYTVPLEHRMTLTETLPHKKKSLSIKFRYILTQEPAGKRLTSHEMQQQQTAAAKSACFWIKVLYFHLFAKHHLATQGSHPNTCYARRTDQRGLLMGFTVQLQSFGEPFQVFQHFLLVLHLQCPAQLCETLTLSDHWQGVRSEGFYCSTIPFMLQKRGRCFCHVAACGHGEHH